MKSIGIIRNIEPLGRIVIPSEIRKEMDIKKGDSIEIHTNGSAIVLQKHKKK